MIEYVEVVPYRSGITVFRVRVAGCADQYDARDDLTGRWVGGYSSHSAALNALGVR